MYTPNISDLTHPAIGDPAGLAFQEIILLKTAIASLSGGSFGARNMVPAGNFGLNPCQRGTVWNAIATSTYTADRFLYKKSGAVVHNVDVSTDVPSVAQAGRQIRRSLRCELVTPDASLAAGDFCCLATGIEAQEAMDVYERTCTLAFWVKATLPGQYAVAFWLGAASPYSCVVPYTINAASTWERKSITMPATPGAVSPYTGEQNGINISWVLASGTTYRATAASTWYAAAQHLALSSTINGVNTGASEFMIADVVFKPGSSADVQDAADLGEVWRHCFRYYQKSMDVTDIPGSVFLTGRIQGRQYTAAATALESLYSRMLVPMRTLNPAITWYSPATGVANRVRDVTAAADLTVGSTSENGRWAAGYPNVTVAPAAGNMLQAGWVALDELVL